MSDDGWDDTHKTPAATMLSSGVQFLNLEDACETEVEFLNDILFTNVDINHLSDLFHLQSYPHGDDARIETQYLTGLTLHQQLEAAIHLANGPLNPVFPHNYAPVVHQVISSMSSSDRQIVTVLEPSMLPSMLPSTFNWEAAACTFDQVLGGVNKAFHKSGRKERRIRPNSLWERRRGARVKTTNDRREATTTPRPAAVRLEFENADGSAKPATRSQNQRTQSRGKEPPAKSSVTKQARKNQPAATDVFTKEEIEEHKNSYSRNTFCPYCDTEFKSATDLRQHIRSKCRTLPLTRILQKSHDRVFKPRKICSLHGKGVSLRALDTFLRQLPPRKGTVLAKTDMVLFWNNKCSHPRGKVLRLTDVQSKHKTRNKHQAQIQEITAGVQNGTINRVLFPVTFFTYKKGKGTPVTRGILKQYLNKEHAALLVIERPAPGMDFEPMYYDSVSKFKIFWPKVQGDALRKKLKEIFGHNIPLREEHKHIYHSLTPNGCAAVVAHWVWTALVKGEVQDPEGYAVIDGLKTYLQDSLQVGIPRKNKAVAN